MLSWWRHNAWWFVVGGGTVAVVGALAMVLTQPSFPLEASDQRASVVGGTMAVLSFPVSAASLWVAIRQQRRDRLLTIEQHLDSLARAVERQWTREGVARGVLQPEPLRVRWSTTTRPVAPAPGEVVPSAAGRVTRLKLQGDVTGGAAAFRRLPGGQLVVIGAPGSGKTSFALLLARDLVRDRTLADPVPVLLNLVGWQPRNDFDGWLTGRLRTEYPFLRDSAAELVTRGLVLPVLDGLDEMPAELRRKAVDDLTDAVGGNRPLIVTCRSDEYAATIGDTGTPLARAAVVEMEPLTVAQVARYLPAGQVNGESRWASVIAQMAAQRIAPVDVQEADAGHCFGQVSVYGVVGR